MQVVSPNGWEKYEVGQQVEVQWRSAGLTEDHTWALINAGGATVDNWLDDRYRSEGSSTYFTNAVDRSGVTDPVPEAVYQKYSYAS